MANLSDLVGLRVGAVALEIDPLLHAVPTEDVMAASCAFLEAEVEQESTEV